MHAECYDCPAQRDPRTVRPTSANRSFQRRGPGAVRRSALSWLSPHPHRWHSRFTPRLPRKPSTARSSLGRFRSTSLRRSATSDAPVIARQPRAWLSPCSRLPHDLGRFHAEPVKDIRAVTTRSAFRRWMPSSGLPRSRDFAAAIRLSPPFHLPRCDPHQASSPSTSAEHEPLETSSNGDFIESRRRPPTSAVRPSSRARSRALDPRQDLLLPRDARRNVRPPRPTVTPWGHSLPRASVVTAGRSRESGFAPRADTRGRRSRFHRLPAKGNDFHETGCLPSPGAPLGLPLSRSSDRCRLAEWLAPP